MDSWEHLKPFSMSSGLSGCWWLFMEGCQRLFRSISSAPLDFQWWLRQDSPCWRSVLPLLAALFGCWWCFHRVPWDTGYGDIPWRGLNPVMVGAWTWRSSRVRFSGFPISPLVWYWHNLASRACRCWLHFRSKLHYSRRFWLRTWFPGFGVFLGAWVCLYLSLIHISEPTRTY